VPPPPFFIKGTLISKDARAAIVVVREMEGSRRPEQTVTEGATLDGYRLTTINMQRVYFEKDGSRFLLVVGADRAARLAPGEPILPQRPGVPDMNIVAPPSAAELEQARRGAEQLIEHMRQSPKVQERLKERRRQWEEEQSSHAPLAPPGPTPP